MYNATYMGEQSFVTNYPYWSGNACPPTSNTTTTAGPAEACQQGKYADYAVRATSSSDVSKAVKFARDWNIRVAVKNTGHDFLGRNLGFGSLSIWTRHIKGIQWLPEWEAENRTAGEPPYAAVRYGAGENWATVNHEVRKRGYAVVSGSEGTVGAAGGWLQGGGHGWFSNQYGLGVENVLQFEAVLPTGEMIVANGRWFPDLFWALRGGGGSTFAIVTAVVYKAYPKPPMAMVWLDFSPNLPDRDPYYQALSYWYVFHKNLTDFGLSGYPAASKWGYTGPMVAPFKTDDEVKKFLAPVQDRMLKQWNITFNVIPASPVLFDIAITPLDKPTVMAEQSGQLYTMGSRLVARSKLTEENLPKIYKFVKTTMDDNVVHLPYPNMPGIAKRDRQWDYALNRAWLDSSIHLALLNNDFKSWTDIPDYFKIMHQKYIPLLDVLSQDSGAYFNEVRQQLTMIGITFDT
jgi:hypothetical protein